MGTGRSVTAGQHTFAQIPRAEIQRSSFNRSSGLKTSFAFGELIPVFVDEALPGDTFNCQMLMLARLATPLHPPMENMFLDVFFFAVPYRLVWDNWEKFNGAQDDPGDSTDFTIPTMTAPGGGYAETSLSDYLGIPTKIASLEHSSLWHRSYNLIWNEWFRDENLQDSVVVDKDDGPDTDTDYVILKRGKRHDYFTSCLPWPQKGTAVSLPLGTTAPLVADIEGDGTAPLMIAGAQTGNMQKDTSSNPSAVGMTGTGVGTMNWSDPHLQLDSGAYADLSTATAATINELRQAFQFQRLMERDARGGTRYTEIIRSHFGVVSPDQRLQRPEYLGGVSNRIVAHQVETTTNVSRAVGDLGAYAVATNPSNRGFTKSFTEHCLILGLASARADLNYQQGLDRMFSRSTRYDFYWPALAHLGEQAVLNKEIYADGSANDDLTFGYQERYAEYRYKPSKVTAEMRSNASSSLDIWHLAQDFAALPALNDAFIQENPPVDRILAVPAEPDLIADFHFSLKCARPMPLYSVPGLIDHF